MIIIMKIELKMRMNENENVRKLPENNTISFRKTGSILFVRFYFLCSAVLTGVTLANLTNKKIYYLTVVD